jgi:hypothetical protein
VLFGKEIERIATALERLVLIEQTKLAQQGVFLSFDDEPPVEPGEVLLTDPDRLAELEAKREKYAKEVGIHRPNAEIGPTQQDGSEWPPEEEATPFESPFAYSGTQGGGGEGLLSPGPEGAESDEDALEEGGSEGKQPSGHIPR